jgi:putative Mg2+ transporter-C (MgtC) family protein
MDTWLRYVLAWIPIDMVSRLLIAMIAGAIIGWEREKHDKPAGLRTHMLVSLGAAAFMLGAVELCSELENVTDAVTLDPLRALAGIIGGVGFLGAGSIIQSRGSVSGVTTAASIWVCAAIGTCSGMGLHKLAILCGVLTLIVLWGVGALEHYMLGTKTQHVDD